MQRAQRAQRFASLADSAINHRHSIDHGFIG
jgi:hypothetical protein